MSLISKESIQQVMDRLDAITLVEEYVRMEKKGGRWWGRCPFHAGGQEKTASFTVDPDKKMYHCFGCGKGGGIIGFVMEMEKITYPEAVKAVARKLGVPLTYEDSGVAQEESPDEKNKEALYELYGRSAGTFHHFLLQNPQKNAAYQYLVSRGINTEMMEKFRLGYAPPDRNWLYRFLSGKGYSPEFLDSSGLFSATYRGSSFFSHRLMFPIVDRQGRTIAFGGRAMPEASEDEQKGSKAPPKYLNSRDSEIFKKGQNLFAINLALDEIRRTKTVFIAEGYMDVIALHQADVRNAVAPLGTAFTDEQAKLLRRWAEKAVLVFDSDKAGQDAAYKGILACRKNGLACSLVIPGTKIETEGENNADSDEKWKKIKDPADILMNFGVKTLNISMKCVILDFDYLISRAKTLYNVSRPGGKRAAIVFMFPYFESLDSETERNESIRAAAEAFEADPEAARKDYDHRQNAGRVEQRDLKATESPIHMNDELFLLTVIAVNPVLYPEFRRSLEISEVEDPAAKELYVALEECFSHEEFGMDALLARIRSNALKEFISRRGISPEFREDGKSGRDPAKLAADGLKRVKVKKLKARLSGLVAELRKGEREDAPADLIEELLEEKMRIDAELRRMEGK